MKQEMIQAFPVLKGEKQFNCMAFVEMPVGTDPFMIIPTIDGMAVMGIGDPKAVMAPHELLVIGAGADFRLPLGRVRGKFIGYHHTGADVGFVFLVEDAATAAARSLVGHA